jgi:uncharacterized protein DUF3179
MQASSARWLASGLLSVGLLGACGETATIAGSAAQEQCSGINPLLIVSGGPGKDGIPALTNPELVSAGAAGAAYLRDDDRVIGVLLADVELAVPLNIGWWHEIVNLEVGSSAVAVTHCPLTGSSLAFDRSVIGRSGFGVSGLLYQNNLIMYDRTTSESLWPQMLRGARCGPRAGASLTMLPVIEMTWRGWRELHPNTVVVSSATGISRNYQNYPYGDYDRIDNSQLLFPIARIDSRRPPKERVLGIPSGDGGIAFPFGELQKAGQAAALNVTINDDPTVVLWDAARQSVMAFRRRVGTQELAFEVRAGAILDLPTRSTWTVDGRAIAGPLAGQRLEPIAEAYIAYWFAWADFHRSTTLWSVDA